MTRARLVHPIAWWAWAMCLAWAAMRTSNILLLLAIAAVAGFVVSARRSRAVWGNAFRLLLLFGVVSIVVTMLLQVVLGTRVPGHTVINLPRWDLPSWSAGLSFGGPITGEALLNSFTSGLRLAVLVACFGAANSLAHPARLLRLVPASLYELGVAVIVALTFIPQLTESIVRVRGAQRLRGRSLTGFRGLRGLAVPVLEESLDRAISLAGSMDSRGYGRTAALAPGLRRITNTLLLTGLAGTFVGSYFIVDPSADHGLGVLALVGGTGIAVLAAFLAGRRVQRTRYRQDPWGRPEWLTLGCALTMVGCYLLGHPNVGESAVLHWPTLPVIPFVGTLLAAVAGVLTPSPVGAR